MKLLLAAALLFLAGLFGSHHPVTIKVAPTPWHATGTSATAAVFNATVASVQPQLRQLPRLNRLPPHRPAPQALRGPARYYPLPSRCSPQPFLQPTTSLRMNSPRSYKSPRTTCQLDLLRHQWRIRLTSAVAYVSGGTFTSDAKSHNSAVTKPKPAAAHWNSETHSQLT
jgi:hypothetical protein